MQGPVLQPFSYDEAHPYAAGQHRGIDIGAAAAGETRGRAGGGHGQLRRHRADERQVGHDRDGRRLLGHAHASRLDRRRERCGGRRARRRRHGRSERHARGGPAVRPPRDSRHGRSERLPRSARVPAAGLGRRCNGERSGSIAAEARAAVRRPHLRPARARRLRRRPRANPLGSRTRSRSVSTGRRIDRLGDREPRFESTPTSVRRSHGRVVRGNGPGQEAIVRPVRPAGRRVRVDGPPTSSVPRPVVEPAAPVEPSGLDAGHEIRPTVAGLAALAGAAGYAHRACAADPQRRRSRGRSRGSAPGRPRPTPPARHAPCRGGSDSSPAPTRGDTAARVARCLRSREPALRPRSRRLV